MADAGMSAWQVTALVELEEYYIPGEKGEGGFLQRLLGRPPVRFDQFLADNASAFAPQAPQIHSCVQHKRNDLSSSAFS
jgi:hypothetical protein